MSYSMPYRCRSARSERRWSSTSAKRNWSGVDRTLGRSGRLPLGDGVALPWAVVDNAYAHVRPELAQALRSHDVEVLYDSSAWRYREAATFGVEAMTKVPYASPHPIDRPGDELHSFVKADLRSPAALGASAYLIPGFVPRDRHDDVTAMTLAAIDVALGMQDLAPHPLIAFCSSHRATPVEAHPLRRTVPPRRRRFHGHRRQSRWCRQLS